MSANGARGLGQVARTAIVGGLTALSMLAVASSSGRAQTLLDPLHGYCAGAGQCIDNGIVSPTTNNPPVNFGFTVSPGPASGSQYMVDILTPTNKSAGPSFTLTGPSGTATLFSATPFTSGFLDAYLGINASGANPIGAMLPTTQGVDAGATCYFVFNANLGPITLQGPSNPNLSPLENITSGTLPLGSVIVAFLNEGTASNPDWIATANSGVIFEDSPPTTRVPEPGTLLVFGAGLLGLALLRRRWI